MRRQFYIRPYDTPDGVEKLKKALQEAEAVIIGAGAGLSTSAGFIYTGERFEKYFPDFIAKYHFEDMYSGGFFIMDQSPEESWAYWSRYIYVNRYMDPPKPVYEELLELVKDKDYFVLTTNVDHCFQKAGFDKSRLFYTQGDYGLWQCSRPCHKKTYSNEEAVRRMILAQGFVIGDDGTPEVPEGTVPGMTIPSGLVPRCPVCGEPVSMNLRADDSFVEDEGWHRAAGRYSDFLNGHMNAKTLFLELAAGYNTPGIIKYSFWRMAKEWPDAMYACINYGQAYAPEDIRERSICINGDAGSIIKLIKTE